jgi:hypothetical protein
MQRSNWTIYKTLAQKFYDCVSCLRLSLDIQSTYKISADHR